jgi:hypothetical protein
MLGAVSGYSRQQTRCQSNTENDGDHVQTDRSPGRLMKMPATPILLHRPVVISVRSASISDCGSRNVIASKEFRNQQYPVV